MDDELNLQQVLANLQGQIDALQQDNNNLRQAQDEQSRALAPPAKTTTIELGDAEIVISFELSRNPRYSVDIPLAELV